MTTTNTRKNRLLEHNNAIVCSSLDFINQSWVNSRLKLIAITPYCVKIIELCISAGYLITIIIIQQWRTELQA